MKNDSLIIPKSINPSNKVLELMDEFINNFDIYEVKNNVSLLAYYDKKSQAYYLMCHIKSQELVNNMDLQASIIADNDEEDVIYKLNREITEDEAAYKKMEEDAKEGRSFEDMVIEYDKNYKKEKPLKVYGGQHRLTAISNAEKLQNDIYHGIRVYFDLDKNQKVEIATINNTSIGVPNDLLDRMREQLLGSELREWCQNVGLLDKKTDFSDKRSPDIPTVRIVRTLLLNFYQGKENKKEEWHQPIVAKSGIDDERYLELRKNIDWSDPELSEMGVEFARLNKLQHEKIKKRKKDNYAEYARKALSYTVVASWSYAAGLYQEDKNKLKKLYSLPDNLSEFEDPLNAKALSQARLKATDPDTYRGLGTRTSNNELGRMLEVFIILCTNQKQLKITLDLANAAIQSYEAKKATLAADKLISKI